MGSSSSIEWTEATWNPVTGCTKVSPGCRHCYAERMAERLQAMGQERYQDGFNLRLHPDIIELPLTWRKARTIFVNSMGDLFHDGVPEDFIHRVYSTMERARRHTFQVLTKRSARLRALAPRLPWSKNIWQGVTVEDADHVSRISDLVEVPAAVRFLSLEPLLGPIPHLPLAGVDWVIVGGESGPGARPISESWVEEIREQCEKQRVSFFFKQWGGVNKARAGRELAGRTWDAVPEPSLRWRGDTSKQEETQGEASSIG